MHDRKKILQDLKSTLSGLPKLPLPVSVTKIFVFGSFLRNRRLINDCDLVVVFEFNDRARQRWSEFLAAIRNGDLADRIIIDKLNKSSEQYLQSKRVNSDWFRNLPPHMIRDNDLSGALFCVVRNMLFKNRQGFHVYLCEEAQFERGDIPGIHDLPLNCVFLWSPDRNDIDNNLDQFDEKEQLDFFQKELDYLIRDISKVEKDSEERRATNAPRRLGDETTAELIEKCESARDRIRDLRRRTSVSD